MRREILAKNTRVGFQVSIKFVIMFDIVNNFIEASPRM